VSREDPAVNAVSMSQHLAYAEFDAAETGRAVLDGIERVTP
jgi:hypothetical protein